MFMNKQAGMREASHFGVMPFLLYREKEDKMKTKFLHRILSASLVGLGVSERIAEQDACELEHAISSESFSALKRLTERIC